MDPPQEQEHPRERWFWKRESPDRVRVLRIRLDGNLTEWRITCSVDPPWHPRVKEQLQDFERGGK